MIKLARAYKTMLKDVDGFYGKTSDTMDTLYRHREAIKNLFTGKAEETGKEMPIDQLKDIASILNIDYAGDSSVRNIVTIKVGGMERKLNLKSLMRYATVREHDVCPIEFFNYSVNRLKTVNNSLLKPEALSVCMVGLLIALERNQIKRYDHSRLEEKLNVEYQNVC